jgi:hypothetical protein
MPDGLSLLAAGMKTACYRYLLGVSTHFPGVLVGPPPPPFTSAIKCHQNSTCNSAGSSVWSLAPRTPAPVVRFLAFRRAQSRSEVPKVRLGISTTIRCTLVYQGAPLMYVTRCALVYQGAPLMCQGAPWKFKTRPSWLGRVLAGRGGPVSIKAHLETQGAPVAGRACMAEPAARGAGVKCARARQAPARERDSARAKEAIFVARVSSQKFSRTTQLAGCAWLLSLPLPVLDM